MRKEMLTVAIIMILLILIIPLPTAYAGTINTNEQKVITAAKAIYEYDGKKYRVDSSYIDQLTNYLASDGIDLTSEQKDAVIETAFANIENGVKEGYLVPINDGTESPADNENTNSGDDSTGTNTNTGNDTDNSDVDNNPAPNGETTTGGKSSDANNEIEQWFEDSTNPDENTNSNDESEIGTGTDDNSGTDTEIGNGTGVGTDTGIGTDISSDADAGPVIDSDTATSGTLDSNPSDGKAETDASSLSNLKEFLLRHLGIVLIGTVIILTVIFVGIIAAIKARRFSRRFR